MEGIFTAPKEVRQELHVVDHAMGTIQVASYLFSAADLLEIQRLILFSPIFLLFHIFSL